MAGDWIKVETCLPEKQEVDLMANRLGIDHDAIVGKLIRLWGWADQHTTSGDAIRVTETFIDRLTNCSGFAAGLIEAGWMTRRNGLLSLPNFDRHNGQTAKTRALTKKRMKRSRDGNVTPSASPEKRREEKSNKKYALGLQSMIDDQMMPEEWSDSETLESINEYCKFFARNTGFEFDCAALRNRLKIKCEGFSAEKIRRSMSETIAGSNTKTFFDPDDKPHNRSGSKDTRPAPEYPDVENVNK